MWLNTIAASLFISGCRKQAADPAQERWAVLLFDDLSADTSHRWLRRGIPEQLGRQLRHPPRLVTLLSQPDPQASRAIAIAGGVTHVLRGNFRARGGALQIQVEIEDVRQGKPRYLQVNVCWAETEEAARKTAHHTVPTVALPGELGNILPTPKHYEQAVGLVSEDDIAEAVVCGPDPERHLDAIRRASDAGYDHIHIDQVGPDQRVEVYVPELDGKLGVELRTVEPEAA